MRRTSTGSFCFFLPSLSLSIIILISLFHSAQKALNIVLLRIFMPSVKLDQYSLSLHSTLITFSFLLLPLFYRLTLQLFTVCTSQLSLLFPLKYQLLLLFTQLTTQFPAGFRLEFYILNVYPSTAFTSYHLPVYLCEWKIHK